MGFKISVNISKHLLYGDKVIAGSAVSERTQVAVDFDFERKVSLVMVSKGLIGP